MKTALLTVALLASQLCMSQRILETTAGSWNYPNLSVETKNGYVISGFTEPHPVTGLLCPTFKINNPGGGPMAAFHLRYPDNVCLMDFTLRPSTNTLVYTGIITSGGMNAPYKMIVAEWNYVTGIMVQSWYQNNAQTMIPHQVVVSETMNQVVVVGTRVNGVMTAANFATIPKSGFALQMSLANFGALGWTREMNTPLTGTNDSDMFEAIVEVPGSGYVITGSGNGPTNEQNLYTMGITFGNGLLFGGLTDNTNFRSAGASLLYAAGAAGPTVYLLANTSVMHQFQVAQINAVTGAYLTPLINHQIATLPIGGGVDQNGFQLVRHSTGRIIVGGYLSAPTGAMPELLTCFQMTLTPALGFSDGRYYRSGNNAPLFGYFEERGNSVYINTPDMICFNPTAARTFLVSHNNVNGGFDLNRSQAAMGGCERPFTVTSGSTPPVFTTAGVFTPLTFLPTAYDPSPTARPMNQSMLCQQPLAPMQPDIYPNPATTELYVSLGEETQVASVTIYDLKGNKVLEQAVTERLRGDTKIDVALLQAGVYVITIRDTDGMEYREKFVKE